MYRTAMATVGHKTMPRVTYEAAHGEVETLDCRYAGHDEAGVFVVCLSEESDGGEYKTQIPINRVIRINEGLTGDQQ